VGELSIASRRISHGYLKYDNSAFNILPDGWITFKTGDIMKERRICDMFGKEGKRITRYFLVFFF